MRCRDLLADERAQEARVEINRAHALLDELEHQPFNDEQTRDVIGLLQLAVRLEAKLRLYVMRQAWRR